MQEVNDESVVGQMARVNMFLLRKERLEKIKSNCR